MIFYYLLLYYSFAAQRYVNHEIQCVGYTMKVKPQHVIVYELYGMPFICTEN